MVRQGRGGSSLRFRHGTYLTLLLVVSSPFTRSCPYQGRDPLVLFTCISELHIHLLICELINICILTRDHASKRGYEESHGWRRRGLDAGETKNALDEGLFNE